MAALTISHADDLIRIYGRAKTIYASVTKNYLESRGLLSYSLELGAIFPMGRAIGWWETILLLAKVV